MTTPTATAATLYAFAIGITRHSAAGKVLDCFFPAPLKEPDAAIARVVREHFEPGHQPADGAAIGRFVTALEALPATPQLAAVCALYRQLAEQIGQPAQGSTAAVAVVLPTDAPIDSTETAYLKLHLLSHRQALPNTQNLDNIFAHLPNVAWTSEGPVDVEELVAAQLAARLAGRQLEVLSIDKFPRMTNYVVPKGVRIADASRIRLGAYLGDGTTVMHEGFINFNAGTLGPNMVEGRISQGVVLGADTDLGGGASTMGTLSGGGSMRISLGRNCLIGANAGTGIPLGDRCTIEAGLYLTAGTRVVVLDETGSEQKTVKARELAGGSDMLFIRNSQNGRIECRTNRNAIALNEQLHAHN